MKRFIRISNEQVEPREPMDCKFLGWYYHCIKRDTLTDPFDCARCEEYEKETEGWRKQILGIVRTRWVFIYPFPLPPKTTLGNVV